MANHIERVIGTIRRECPDEGDCGQRTKPAQASSEVFGLAIDFAD
jgi:hypothetical protein